MLFALLSAAAGLVLLYFGGERLVAGAAALAARGGISPLVIGLTVVAFGTSMPELVVSVDAALAGAAGIALGNVIGSNIANIALILGIAALIMPLRVEARIVRIDAPIMIAATIALAAVLADGRVSRPEGVLLLLGLVAYTAFTLWQARAEPAGVQQEFAEGVPGPTGSAGAAVVSIVLGLALLVGGGHLLVRGAVTLAALAGISEAVIGLTIVAVGTSLPELATTAVAAARGRGDIALGNVIGSNIFNVLGILGATALVTPLAASGTGWRDVGVALGLALLVTVFLYTRLRVDRAEGAVLLALYAGYTAWLLTG